MKGKQLKPGDIFYDFCVDGFENDKSEDGGANNIDLIKSLDDLGDCRCVVVRRQNKDFSQGKLGYVEVSGAWDGNPIHDIPKTVCMTLKESMRRAADIEMRLGKEFIARAEALYRMIDRLEAKP